MSISCEVPSTEPVPRAPPHEPPHPHPDSLGARSLRSIQFRRFIC